MADKTKSIKNATDKELDELLIRLRKETEVQNLVGQLKRKSAPNTPFSESISYDRPEVSTEEPIESLYHKVDATLAHYGILGMKWGVRRKRGPDGLVVQSEDHKKVENLREKKVVEMSNVELKELNTRLQLEKQFKDLTKVEQSAGKKFVTDIFRDAGKDVLKRSVAEIMQATMNEMKKIAAKKAVEAAAKG